MNFDETHKTRKRSSGLNSRKGILVHYTASQNFDADVATLSVGDAKVSCHYVISPTGRIAKIGAHTDILWHAGVSKLNPSASNRLIAPLDGLNAHTIGIELTNFGRLTRSAKTRNSNVLLAAPEPIWVTHTGREFDGKVMPDLNDQRYGWPVYPAEQLEALEKLVRYLIDSEETIEFVTGHEVVSPGRKIDPGPAFPAEFYQRASQWIDARKGTTEVEEMYGDDTTKFEVSVSSSLNVRNGPGVNHAVVGSLKNGAKVTVRSTTSNGWADIGKGWVSNLYLKPR